MIEVLSISQNPYEFQVTVKTAGSQTSHRVTMSVDYHHLLTGGQVSAERCVEAAFEFLLEREPKESILTRFDMTVISHYFPDFEKRIADYF